MRYRWYDDTRSRWWFEYYGQPWSLCRYYAPFRHMWE